MLLSLGTSGYPFVGADIGGFFGNPPPELLLRWYQAGAFQPFFRAHAHIETARREPYLIAEPFKGLIKQAIYERYKLLPYIYTLFYESHREGAPVVRPLLWEFFNDKSMFEVEDQYMLGSSLLIKPICDEAVDVYSVVFPSNTKWYCYFTGELVSPTRQSSSFWETLKAYRRLGIRHLLFGDYASTSTLKAQPTLFPVNLSSILVFSREGSIIPLQLRKRRSTTALKFDPYSLLITLSSQVSVLFTLWPFISICRFLPLASYT